MKKEYLDSEKMVSTLLTAFVNKDDIEATIGEKFTGVKNIDCLSIFKLQGEALERVGRLFIAGKLHIPTEALNEFYEDNRKTYPSN